MTAAVPSPIAAMLNEMMDKLEAKQPASLKDALIRKVCRVYKDGDFEIRGPDEHVLYGLLEQLGDLVGVDWNDNQSEMSVIRAEFYGEA